MMHRIGWKRSSSFDRQKVFLMSVKRDGGYFSGGHLVVFKPDVEMRLRFCLRFQSSVDKQVWTPLSEGNHAPLYVKEGIHE
jgi:hypothetical protein